MKKIFYGICFLTLVGQISFAQDSLYLENGEFEGKWPFIVDSAAIWCGEGNSLYIMSYGDDDGTYALNDEAKTHPEYFENVQVDISPIWKNNKETGEKIALTDVINFGLKNSCK